MKSIKVITIFNINSEVLLLYSTDFQGNNNFTYIANNIGGYNAVESIVNFSINISNKIVIGLPILSKQFSQNEKDKVYFNLVKNFDQDRILYKKDDIKQDFEAFVYKDHVDIAWAGPEKISIVMFEPSSHFAVFSYLTNGTPPFNPIDIAETMSALLLNKGFCRLLCSRGYPPSSQDIEKHLTHGHHLDLPIASTMCPDVMYTMVKTEQTKYIDDKEEFHLGFMEIASKYKKYSKLIGLKLAVIESCFKQNLPLACGTTSKYRKWEMMDGKKVINMMDKEDCVVPLNIIDPHLIVIGAEQG